MRNDTEMYLKQFPLDPSRLYEQDCMHELEYGAMYRGEIPKDNNWGFYLYMTAKDRHKRMMEYNRKVGGAELVVIDSPLQMRRSSGSGKRRRSRLDSRVRRRLGDRKIIKRMKRELVFDTPMITMKYTIILFRNTILFRYYHLMKQESRKKRIPRKMRAPV